MKYATRAGRRRAVQHDARRRPRAVLRLRRRAGGSRDVLRPRRGRRRPHPGRRRHAQHAVARARGRSPRASTSTPTRSSRRCSRTSRSRRSRQSPRRRKAFGYFRPTDGVSFDRARQLSRRPSSARIGLARRRLPPADPARVQAARRERHRDAQMMVNTLVAGKYASEHDAKIAMKLANVLCGGVGGAHARGHRGRDPRARARGVPVSLCGEPLIAGAHAVHAPEQQAAEELGAMTEIVIAEAVRSAVGRGHKGSLATKRPDELAADVIRGLLARVPQAQGQDRRRRARLRDARGRAGPQRRAPDLAARRSRPSRSPAQTINRFCSSGLQAIATAAGSIAIGTNDIVLAGGVESMTLRADDRLPPVGVARADGQAARREHADGHHGRERREPVRHLAPAAGRVRATSRR